MHLNCSNTGNHWTYSHFGAFSNKCTKSKKMHLKSDTITYLFAFNGKEKIDEINGAGNDLDFGARIYDGRLGRFLSVDAYTSMYVSISPYAFCGNTPTWLVDYDGNKFINPNTINKPRAIQSLSDARDAYNGFMKNHPDLKKNPNFFRKLFNVDYREKGKLKDEIEMAQSTLNEIEQKEVLVNNLLKTFEVVDPISYNHFETMTNPDGSDVLIIVNMSDEYKFDGALGTTPVAITFDPVSNNTTLFKQDITLYKSQGYSTFMNELGDIEFAKNQISSIDNYNEYKNPDIPYWERKETKFSSEYEGKANEKFENYKSENKVKKEDLDERGSIK